MVRSAPCNRPHCVAERMGFGLLRVQGLEFLETRIVRSAPCNRGHTEAHCIATEATQRPHCVAERMGFGIIKGLWSRVFRDNDGALSPYKQAHLLPSAGLLALGMWALEVILDQDAISFLQTEGLGRQDNVCVYMHHFKA